MIKAKHPSEDTEMTVQNLNIIPGPLKSVSNRVFGLLNLGTKADENATGKWLRRRIPDGVVGK